MARFIVRWTCALVVALGVVAPTAFACLSDAECDDGVACTLIDTCQLGVCVPGGGGDTDGDGLCNVEDNCPAFANAAQDDLDGDNTGDACDPTDRDLNLVVVKVMRNVSTTDKHNGRIFLKGDFLTLGEAAFNATSGFRVRVQDGPGASLLDIAFAWSPTDCQTNSSGTIKCKSPDKRVQAVFSPIKGFPGAAYRFTQANVQAGGGGLGEGAVPVPVSLPLRGKAVNFEKLLALDETLEVSFDFRGLKRK